MARSAARMDLAIDRPTSTGSGEMIAKPVRSERYRDMCWLALAGWWLALGDCFNQHRPCHHYHRHPVRMGASKARWHCTLAYRQDHCARAGCSTEIPSAEVKTESCFLPS